MRKLLNIATIILSIWLAVDVLHAPQMLLSFLLVGEVPGLNISLSPTLMMALLTVAMGVVIFEIAARRYNTIRHWRRRLLSLAQ